MEQSGTLSIFDSRKEERLNAATGDQISARKYNAVMLLTLMWGFLVNAVMVEYLALPVMRLFSGIGPMWLFIGYFVLALAGVFISAKSQNPWISFLGYNLLVMPIGVMLCFILPGFPVSIITKALLLTGIVTATMTLLGLVRPQIFLGLGRTLLIALLVGIVAELVATFLLHYTGTLFRPTNDCSKVLRYLSVSSCFSCSCMIRSVWSDSVQKILTGAFNPSTYSATP